MGPRPTVRPRVVALHKQGVAADAIADTLGICAATVKTHLHRARGYGELPPLPKKERTTWEQWRNLQAQGAAPPLGTLGGCLQRPDAPSMDDLLGLMQRDDRTLADALLRIAMETRR